MPRLFRLLTVACLLSAISVPAKAVTRLSMPSEHIHTQFSGTLAPDQQQRIYSLQAQKGQYAVLNLSGTPDSQETANVGVIVSPSGIKQGNKGHIVYQDCLPESGLYHLQIARNLMATHGGRAGYTAELIILPKYASQKLCGQSSD